MFLQKLKYYFTKIYLVYLLIILVSIFFSIYIFEGYLTLKQKPIEYKNEIYKKNTNSQFDNRTKYEIYNDLTKKNKKIVVSSSINDFLNTNYEIIPLSGISNSITIDCNENGYYSIYESDRFGFNNPDSEWDKEPKHIVLLGDSYVHGACVNRPFDISSVLRQKSKLNILNLGYRGTGTLAQFAVLREYLNPQIKKVVWFYYEDNDLIDLYAELKDNKLNKYFLDSFFSQNLIFNQSQVNEINNNKIFEKKLLFEKSQLNNTSTDEEIFIENIFNFIKLLKTRTLFFKKNNNFYLLENLPSHIIDDFREIFKKAKILTENNNTKLYFVYLPSYSRYSGEYNNMYYKKIINIITELEIPILDIHTDLFQKEKDPLKYFPFKMYGHFNEEGYKRVSESVYKFIN